MTSKQKVYRKLDEIKETFLSLSGTVYGYQDHNICYCRDQNNNYGKCVSTLICMDCDLNKSGECPVSENVSIPGVS
jgi:hypothetical protein